MKMFGSKYTGYLALALLLLGCSRVGQPDTLSEEDKTPLVIEASLSTSGALTKAADKNFAENDKLLAYLRHTTGTVKGSYTLVTTDKSPLLVTFTKGSVAMSTVDANTNRTANDLTPHIPLYWEDFSNSASDDTDLRSDNHGLQSYYGYCYNGGTPSTALVQETGVLGWTIQTNQSTAENVQHSDLLWSPEQTTTPYYKGSMAFTATYALTIPYTHAMSEVTVTVTCADGFSGNPLTNSALTLNAMSTVTTLTAPTGAYTSVPGEANANIKNIAMYAESYTSALTRNYTAIVGPGTKFKVGEKLLDIVNVDDNNYTLKVTDAMLAADKWATGHTTDIEGGKTFILTKPGYNYHLNITVSKTAVSVEATLQDWTTVNASGTGVIQYPNDVVSINVTGNSFADASSMSLFWQKADGESNDDASERTNESYTYATVSSYSGSAWTNTPAIYWPNKTDNYYYRALAKFNSTTENVHSITSVGTYDSNKGTAVSQGTIGDGHDILWGTTPAHTGTPGDQNFTAGQALPPRTGNVPITFEHALSKVTIRLETASDEVNANSPAVNLTGATIAVSNLSVSGTIAIEDGAVTPAATTAAAIAATAAPISDLVVMPQTIGNDAKVTITLTDGTTYSLQLNECVITGGSTPIGIWERGKHYVYTIHLEKEAITFRALVKDWEEKTGSGDANLEWD